MLRDSDQQLYRNGALFHRKGCGDAKGRCRRLYRRRQLLSDCRRKFIVYQRGILQLSFCPVGRRRVIHMDIGYKIEGKRDYKELQEMESVLYLVKRPNGHNGMPLGIPCEMAEWP